MIAETVKPVKQHNDPEYAINPTKFVLWLLIAASVMLFAAFTSAYIVRRGEGNWNVFELPSFFTYTTVIIAISSVFMQWAYMAARKDEMGQLKIATTITLILGIAFAAGQWLAYKELVSENIYLAGNPSESFIYVISFMHLMHVLGGLVFVGIITVKSFRFKVHKKNLLSINLCTTYWHFLGLLWVYLFFFFQLNR